MKKKISKEDLDTKILLEIRDIINSSTSDINAEPIMYHCEQWRRHPKPVMVITRGTGDNIRKIGNLELE